MNKLIKLAGALALVMTATLAQAQGKIAVVDTAEVFQKMPQRDVIRNQLKNEFASRVKEVQQLEEQGRSFVEKQQKDMAFMNDSQKAEAQKKLNEMQATFVQKARALEQDRARRENEERQKMLSRIKGAIDDITKAQGLDLVIERGAVIHVSPSLDITQQVISRVSK
ncbi:outer membrane protein OmpH [Oceanimonas sp. GK1]|uniref:OmpH family outer membrane protein n=1 Tax=Oceanimonas sp. (strain GK1 / IBRC-M 10197) TaxID=511062 RepID=UPI0002495273|nr:OmpH family outer membrane protein [Oceanimonas sp. GK1]AEY02342.1 outer membrane protein OmpH [Oceanimonas sp. GK1]